MNTTYTSKVAAEKARETAARFEEFARETPETMRVLAEKNITQAREVYERSKNALEAVLDSWETSFDAANQGAMALNRKIIDIAQRNINSGFELRSCERPSRGKELCRGYRIAGGLLEQANAHTDGPSGGGAHALDSHHRQDGRTDQSAGDARHGPKPPLTCPSSHEEQRNRGAGRSRRLTQSTRAHAPCRLLPARIERAARGHRSRYETAGPIADDRMACNRRRGNLRS